MASINNSGRREALRIIPAGCRKIKIIMSISAVKARLMQSEAAATLCFSSVGVDARNLMSAFLRRPDLTMSMVERITVNKAQFANSSGETA